jgi:hypothetical protein
MSDDASLETVVCEAVPVYATENVMCKETPVLVPVKIGLDVDMIASSTQQFCYEGKMKHKKFEGIDGIMNQHKLSHSVLVQNKLGANGPLTQLTDIS